MVSPTLRELPPPPAGRTGWPWTIEAPQLSHTMPDGSPWPRISIVTPSYNQGQFIEETIRSILLQGYPDLEYIIIDGASPDEAVDVIKRYEHWLKYWVSESDRGQAHAINKGLARSTGRIFNWINSDDVLLRGALQTVAVAAETDDAIAGAVTHFNSEGYSKSYANARLTAADLVTGPEGHSLQQPGIWLRNDRCQALGGLCETFQFSFDLELLVRYFEQWPGVIYISDDLVRFRLHRLSKTVSQPERFITEHLEICRGLAERAETPGLRAVCLSALRQGEWRRSATTIARDHARSRIGRAVNIALLALEDPANRLNRYSAGAIRHCLLAR